MTAVSPPYPTTVNSWVPDSSVLQNCKHAPCHQQGHNTTEINAHIYPCSFWDLNPKPSGQRNILIHKDKLITESKILAKCPILRIFLKTD